MDKLSSTKLINTSIPPTDGYFPFQLLNFFSIRSSIFSQSLFLSLLKCIETPKYLKG
jgi:hypothetical protein